MSQNPGPGNALAIVEAGESSNNDSQEVPQPRQPSNLQGLLRYAIESGHQDELQNVALPDHLRQPMDPERSAFLARAINNLTVNLEYFVLKAIATLTDEEVLGRLQDLEELTPEVADQFDSLENIIDDIDVANGFCKMRGFDCFPLCYSIRNPVLWQACNGLVGDLTQNNPECQQKALETGLVKLLLQMLRKPTTIYKAKFIYALSCCIREYEPGCKEFISLGGCETLADCLSLEGGRINQKAAFLLRYLCQHYPEAKEILVDLHLPRLIAHLITTEHADHMVALLRTYVEDATPQILRQCREPNLRLKERLQDIIAAAAAADRDSVRDEVDNCSEILKIVFEGYNQLMVDCEEEADR